MRHRLHAMPVKLSQRDPSEGSYPVYPVSVLFSTFPPNPQTSWRDGLQLSRYSVPVPIKLQRGPRLHIFCTIRKYDDDENDDDGPRESGYPNAANLSFSQPETPTKSHPFPASSQSPQQRTSQNHSETNNCHEHLTY